MNEKWTTEKEFSFVFKGTLLNGWLTENDDALKRPLALKLLEEPCIKNDAKETFQVMFLN